MQMTYCEQMNAKTNLCKKKVRKILLQINKCMKMSLKWKWTMHWEKKHFKNLYKKTSS